MSVVLDRIVDRITLDEAGCWRVDGTNNGDGYATFWTVGSGTTLVHRVTYELLRGPIPDGLQIDHLCRVRDCANPWHMETVTMAENIRRGNSPSAVARRLGRCKQGHSFAEHGERNGTKTRCRLCKNRRSRERRARQREAMQATKGMERSSLWQQ